MPNNVFFFINYRLIENARLNNSEGFTEYVINLYSWHEDQKLCVAETKNICEDGHEC